MSKHTQQPLSILKEEYDLRKVWPNEANDFTKWLFEKHNMELLSEALGVEIEGEAREANVGAFRVDIVGTEAETGRKVIIENQLEDTNHDHLGKIITYAAGQDAAIIVWVVKRAREEHRAAIEWLNNNTNNTISFFLCEIKLYRIDNSPLAVKFEVVEKPNGWVKTSSTEWNDTQKLRYEYWDALCQYLDSHIDISSQFTNKPRPCPDHWVNLHIGTNTCHISLLLFKAGEIGVSISIGNDKEYFETLEKDKQIIEAELGNELQWVNNPDKAASSIRLLKKANAKKVEDRENQFAWLCEKAVQMREIALRYK